MKQPARAAFSPDGSCPLDEAPEIMFESVVCFNHEDGNIEDVTLIDLVISPVHCGPIGKLRNGSAAVEPAER